MRKIASLRKPIAVAVVVLVAFAAGMATMHTLGNESVLTVVARIVQLIPGVMKIEEGSGIPAASSLRPLQTFWEVREKIKKDFVYPIKDESELTYGAIRGMLASLNDPWTRFQTPKEYAEFETETEGHFGGIGAVLESRPVGGSDPNAEPGTGEYEVIITSVIPEGPASKTDLRPDDVVVEVDGTPVKGLRLDAVVNRIRGDRGTTVKLGVRRAGVKDLIQIPITRQTVEYPVVEHKMLPGNIGYVWLRSFNKQAATKLREALQDLNAKGMKGLVFDLSIDGGGLLDMAVNVGSMFLPQGQPVVYVQERDAQPQPLNTRGGPVIPMSLPMVVLVDRGSASASEIVAGCLQDHGRALVVGQNTFGKSKVQTVVELEDKSALIMSTAVYLTPKKRDISLDYEKGKRGVKPDRFFPEPAPGTKMKFEDWHNGEIAKATAVLQEQMKKPE